MMRPCLTAAASSCDGREIHLCTSSLAADADCFCPAGATHRRCHGAPRGLALLHKRVQHLVTQTHFSQLDGHEGLHQPEVKHQTNKQTNEKHQDTVLLTKQRAAKQIYNQIWVLQVDETTSPSQWRLV